MLPENDLENTKDTSKPSLSLEVMKAMPAEKIRSKLSTDGGHLGDRGKWPLLRGRGVTGYWGRRESRNFLFLKMLRAAHIHNNSLRKQSTFPDASTGFPAK